MGFNVEWENSEIEDGVVHQTKILGVLLKVICKSKMSEKGVECY